MARRRKGDYIYTREKFNYARFEIENHSNCMGISFTVIRNLSHKDSKHYNSKYCTCNRTMMNGVVPK